MINAIADLGKYILRQNPDMDILDIVLDDAYDIGKNKHLFVIVFKKAKTDSKEMWQFDRIEYCELDSTYKNKILYKRGSGKGTDFTPTTKITDDLEKKTFPNKIVNWFKQQEDNELFSDEEKEFLNEIYKSIEKEKNNIVSEINGKLFEITDKLGKVLTIGFENNNGSGKIDFIGNYDFFKNFLIEEAKKDYKYSNANKTYSFSTNKLCSICNKNTPEVFGFFTDLKFYNVDKPGMITGEFKHGNAWKNYPVCLNCALNVRKGYDFLQNKFNFRFYGLRYYFIPKVSSVQ